MKLDIGSVSVYRASEKVVWRHGLMGPERAKALRWFRDHAKEAQAYQYVAWNPTRTVAWDDVNWETMTP